MKPKKTTVPSDNQRVMELEPKNIIDYIFKGSGLNQFIEEERKERKK